MIHVDDLLGSGNEAGCCPNWIEAYGCRSSNKREEPKVPRAGCD